MDRRWVLAGLVAALSVTSGMWLGRGVHQPAQMPASANTAPPSSPVAEASGTILVHVAGWVTDPGVVSIPQGGRVGDAVAAAGGVRPGADLDRVNLAELLSDGQQVSIPGPGAMPEGEAEDPAGAVTDDGRVRLNTAGPAELERLPGVGPVLAERIVSHRESVGPFQQVEDLLDVAGIGESKLASLRDHVVVP